MIQSVIFDKSIYSLKEAKDWLDERNFKTEVDEKPNYYRFRQVEPNPKYHYYTKELQPGLKIIVIRNHSKLIPYDEARIISKYVKQLFSQKNIHLYEIGSLARKERYIKDLDFITSDSINNKKYNVYKFIDGKYDISIDIWVVPENKLKVVKELRSYPKGYVIALHNGLKKHGYSFKNYNLYDSNFNYIPVESVYDLAKLAKIRFHPLAYYQEYIN